LERLEIPILQIAIFHSAGNAKGVVCVFEGLDNGYLNAFFREYLKTFLEFQGKCKKPGETSNWCHNVSS